MIWGLDTEHVPTNSHLAELGGGVGGKVGRRKDAEKRSKVFTDQLDVI